MKLFEEKIMEVKLNFLKFIHFGNVFDKKDILNLNK